MPPSQVRTMLSLRRLQALVRSEIAVARPNPPFTAGTAWCRDHARSFSSRAGTKPTAWNTKIVCTLGPASSSEQRLEEMIQAGMDVVRLNFSHGTHEQHQKTFELVRRLSARYDHQVAILCDIQGPKIRTGKMKDLFLIQVGDVIRVTPQSVLGTPDRIQIKYQTLLEDLDTDDIIFINDGNVKLVVMEKDLANKDLICKCMAAGTISDNKGCNMPSGRLSVSVVTPKDEEDLKFIAGLDPEFVAASFIGTGADVEQVRNELVQHGNPDIKIIAKLERPVALLNLDDIIRASDALMVARGDLGVEIDTWDVPMWQKEAIKRCNRESKPVIVATQMLESMIQNSRPTRAEASDVYNAVLDGADAVMLSGETSVGAYPVQAVQAMDAIVRVAQNHIPKHDPKEYQSSQPSIAETVCSAVHAFAEQFASDKEHGGKIIVITSTGFAARVISKYRPALPILAFSESLRTVRELALCWGVRAQYLPKLAGNDVETEALCAMEHAMATGYLTGKDKNVCVLIPSCDPSAGFFCGIYDVSRLASKGFKL